MPAPQCLRFSGSKSWTKLTPALQHSSRPPACTKLRRFSKSAEASASTCNKHDKAMQVLLQSKVESMGVPCEEMCKRLGVYPDGCQCPGFNGQAPTPGDGRSCVSQWCQDPKSPCPNDGFVECVDASSKVSALQWAKVMENVDTGFA